MDCTYQEFHDCMQVFSARGEDHKRLVKVLINDPDIYCRRGLPMMSRISNAMGGVPVDKIKALMGELRELFQE